MLASFLRTIPRAAFRNSLGVMTLCAAVAACSDDGSAGGGDGDGDTNTGGTPGDGDGDTPGGAPGDGDSPVYTPMGDPCDFGDDAEKCDGEAAVACTPVLGPTETSCDRDEDCGR